MTDPADQTEAMGGAQITEHLHRSGGIVLGGRYELTERIASGGMASVWRARDDVLARTVAVKLLHDHLAADEAFRERFRREAIAAAKLTHPNVVSLYDTGNDGTRVYLVMEYVDGATLREVIADLRKLEPGQAASIGERIARALDYAHERGLVHRDIKPANILIGDDGSVKVADFGIAKAEEYDGDLTKTGMVLGTAAYVAPEQITGAAVVDGRADQYALGCMLFEALAGRQPFKGDTAVATAAQRLESSPPALRSLRPDIPRGLEAIVMRAMARDPEDRFVSGGVLADALSAFADPDDAHTAALPLATAHRAAPRERPMAAPDSFAPPGGRDSFLRTEGRWLLAVLMLVLVAAAMIGGGIVTGVLDPTRLPGLGPDDTADDGGGGDRPERPLDIEDVSSYDPQGDNAESDSMLPALIDSDDTTTWRTEWYNGADFGGLKEGVGFYVDLGSPQQIGGVELSVETTGVEFEIRVAEDPGDEVGDWEKVAEVADAQDAEPVQFDEAVEARYVLVWIVAPLPPHGGRYQAEFHEIQVLGVARDGGN